MPSDSPSTLTEQLRQLRQQRYVVGRPIQGQRQLQPLLQRLSTHLQQDHLIQDVTDELRRSLQCDRVVLYYFYCEWKGQVTFESLSHPRYSIYGSTGADDCFNDNYAQRYLDGRYSYISDLDTAPIHPCHRDFLSSIHVQANLVVPVLPTPATHKRLWGLLIAHHCQSPHWWTTADITAMQAAAETLAQQSAIERL
jgi:GAF domain-containing protein